MVCQLNRGRFRIQADFGAKAALHGRLRPAILWIIPFALGGILTASAAQDPFLAVARTQVEVSVNEDVPGSLRVRRSYLEESLAATTGYLEVENLSREAISGGNLYAEYFDAAGRFCFSLVFSLDRDLQKRKAPFARSEVRMLYSTAVSIAPATGPKQLRLSWLSGVSAADGAPLMRAPVTVEVRAPTDRDKLRLGSSLESMPGPVLDLVLANLTVSSSGNVENVEVVGAASDELKSWFLKFVANQVFYTASTGGVAEAGNTLLLVRAIVPKQGDRRFLPASTLPWMANYVAKGMDNSVPPVTEIIFGRPPVKAKMGGRLDWTKLPPSPQGLLEPITGASDWCSDSFVLVPDAASPNHFRRELSNGNRP